jgi:hypothetical protein
MAISTDQLTAAQAAMKERQKRAQALERGRRFHMKASATTLNINGPETVESVKPVVEQGADLIGAQPMETITVPISLIADLQRQLDELKSVKQAAGNLSYEQLLFLLQEMRKPDADTQAKIDAEKERAALNRKNMIELTILEEQEKENRQANCGHRKENNRTAFVVANEKDGFYRYICQHCFKVTEPTKTPPENLGISTGGSFQFS